MNKKLFISYKSVKFFSYFLIFTLPFQPLFLNDYKLLTLGQALPYFLLFLLWLIFNKKIPIEIHRKISHLFIPILFFIIPFLISTFLSDSIASKDWMLIVSIIGACGYALLICFLCLSIKDVKEILWLLIIIGLVQLPIIVAMYFGVFNGSQGSLSPLDSRAWEGTSNNLQISLFRYPGSFRDYELLAEYLDITAILSIGFYALAQSLKEKFFSIFSLFIILISGFFTGTRTFIFGIVVGGGFLLIIYLLNFGTLKNKVRLLLFTIGFILVFLFLSSQELFSGLFYRMQNIFFSTDYYDTRDFVWKISIYMLKDLPFWGYGTQMLDKFSTIANTIMKSPHSLYFSILLTLGYQGFFVIFDLVLLPIFWLLLIIKQNKEKVVQLLTFILLCVWIFWAVNELKIEFLRYPYYMNFIMIIYGVINSLFDISRNQINIVKRHNENIVVL